MQSWQMTKSKKRMSYDNMRVGKKYVITNYGETNRFVILAAAGHNDFRVKDLLTLEQYLFTDLIRYGKGEDFELYEL